MYDRELVREILSQILKALDTVLYRFKSIHSVDEFVSSQTGMEKLDAICMQLIAIGEGLKNIDKITEGHLLGEYPDINWHGAKAMRDIISHHYFEIDAEVIYDVCQNKIEPMRNSIKQMHDSLKE